LGIVPHISLNAWVALWRRPTRIFEVIIVDNGSTDNGCLKLEENTQIKPVYKRLEQNTGFAVANNMGAHLARGKYLALLNADAFPSQTGWSVCLKPLKSIPNSFFSSRQIQPIDQIFWMAKETSTMLAG